MIGIDSVQGRHGRGGGWTAAERPKKKKKRKHRAKEVTPREHGTEQHAKEVIACLGGQDETEGGPSQTGEQWLDPTPNLPKNATAVREWNATKPFEPLKHAPILNRSAANATKSTRYVNVAMPEGLCAALIAATPAA